VNCSPCRFGYINNIDAFEYQELVNEDKQQPNITVKEVLEYADRFKACPLNKSGLTVIEPDGSTHEATIWDRHELNVALTPKAKAE
jgi:hypothetical protein